MRKLLLVLLATASLTLIAVICQAQPAPPGPTIGVADVDQILNEYEEFDRLNQEFKQFQSEQAVAFEQRYGIRLLELEERQEYAQLTSDVVPPTSKNRARAAELLALSETREKDLERLRANTEPTAAEKSYLEQLQRLEESSRKELADLRQELMTAREAKHKELNRLITERIDRALEEVAKEKNLSLILSKPQVLYGGTDVTQAVLAKLNAEK